jgi:hypothetical protein
MERLMALEAMMKKILILVMVCHKLKELTGDKEKEVVVVKKTMSQTWKVLEINNK